MSVKVILFCIFCNYIISGQSQHSSDSKAEDSLENRQQIDNIPEIYELEALKENENYKKEEDETNENKNEEDNNVREDQNDDDVDDDDDNDDVVNKKEKEEPVGEDVAPIPPQYKYEINAGDMADLFSTTKHKYVPLMYKDFGRRFVLKYPTNKKPSRVDDEAEANLDRAIKAPPELVLEIAKKSAILEASRPRNPADDLTKRVILRSGDYWNGVWKEDVVIPKKVLRSKNKSLEEYREVLPELETIRVKIMPGSKLHDLVSLTKQISPKLLYIINNKENK